VYNIMFVRDTYGNGIIAWWGLQAVSGE